MMCALNALLGCSSQIWPIYMLNLHSSFFCTHNYPISQYLWIMYSRKKALFIQFPNETPFAISYSNFLQGKGSEYGLTLWRIVQDHPYYRLSLTLEEEEAKWRSSPGFLRRLTSFTFTSSTSPSVSILPHPFRPSIRRFLWRTHFPYC